MSLKALVWFIGLAAAVALLITAFLSGSVFLTFAAFGLALVLKRSNRHIPLPKFYRDKGVRNDLFEGRVRK